jgi:hypothetical protein
MKQVFSKIAKIGEEVRQAEAVKVELALVDDIVDNSRLLTDYANELKALKKSMQSDMRALEALQNDGIQYFRSLSGMQNQLVAKLNELGLDKGQSPHNNAIEKALALWSDANSMKI